MLGLLGPGLLVSWELYLEIVVIDGEIFLHDGSLLLGSTRRWRNKIFRVVVIIHPLEPTGAEGSQQSRNDEKVAGMFTNSYTELEEQFLQCVVHDLQTELTWHLVCVCREGWGGGRDLWGNYKLLSLDCRSIEAWSFLVLDVQFSRRNITRYFLNLCQNIVLWCLFVTEEMWIPGVKKNISQSAVICNILPAESWRLWEWNSLQTDKGLRWHGWLYNTWADDDEGDLQGGSHWRYDVTIRRGAAVLCLDPKMWSMLYQYLKFELLRHLRRISVWKVLVCLLLNSSTAS